MNIAITGPNGLIGSRIIKLLHDKFTFIPLSHSELDITDQNQVINKFNKIDFDLLLHLAAYTNVNGAENERANAFNLNVNATKYLFDEIQKLGKKMIFVSTDFVFDGKNPPFDEDYIPNPVGYYGQTKYEGEKVLNNDAMIVRISYPYRSDVIQSGANLPAGKAGNPGKLDFVARLSQLLKDGKLLTMVTDSSMTPTHIDDIALGLKYLIENFKPEIFHLVGKKSYSPFEIGKMIAKNIRVSADLIKPTTFKEYSKNKAPRPKFSEIISVKNDFQVMRSFEEILYDLK